MVQRTWYSLPLGLLLIAGVAHASIYSDVPDGHMYQDPVETLSKTGVIGGNPDGTFAPDRAVNRAELLKMLYLAKGKTPDQSSVRCFQDVPPNAWFEKYVCDAAVNRYVNGYPDGSFKPGQEVNRVEAIKMITNIFGIEVAEISDSDRDVINFVDVSTSAWYTKYLYAAFSKHMLPIVGQEGPRFYPDEPLLRGESAAYIYNGLNVELLQARAEANSSSSSDEEEESSSSTESEEESSSSATAASSAKSSVPTGQKTSDVKVSFPFDKSGKFDKKRPYLYTFTLDSATTAFTEVELGTAGTVTCRLYLLKENGFSDEYYLGQQEGKKCYLHASLNRGNYQLQLQPSVADATFTVRSVIKEGDGNDGFRDAIRIYENQSSNYTLGVNDITDWFKFVMTAESLMTLDLTNSADLDCLVYPMSDVDLYGFTSPECNKSYLYPEGTYFVAVHRKIASKSVQKSYSILLRR
ncbi:MAG: S-layer homology domain-containing protein [bacterium]|nr:S-layer homology domain-containing protein [bacterium]